MRRDFLEKIREVVGAERLYEAEPMSRHTTFRVGGPADVLVCPEYSELPQLIRLCRDCEIPYCVVGNGSNLLVGDGGIRGVVIELSKAMETVTIDGDYILAEAGALLSRVANLAADHGLTGMEFAAGIPGSIGGAVVMNAGAYGGEMKDIVESVTVLDREGTQKVLTAEQMEFGYRSSCVTEHGYTVMQSRLKLAAGDRDKIRQRMAELGEMRREKQPLEYPSAGSTFKRPEGYYAGKLIMDAGLRGYQVGGAQVSEKHCGFVINRGNATAGDIRRLMKDVSDEVQRQFGVSLEPEVKFLGSFE